MNVEVQRDTSDEETVQDRLRGDTLDKLALEQRYREVMATRHGRAVLWHLLTLCRIYSPSYTGDANSTFFNEGRRSVGLEIISAILTADPEGYNLIRAEAIADDEKRKRLNG